MISINYKDDCLQLLEILKNITVLNKDAITHFEFYPYFQLTDYSVEIYYDGDLIARIYDNNKKCIPFINVQAMQFTSNKITKVSGSVNIGSFSTVLLYSLISIMKARTIQDTDEKDLNYTIVSHLIQMRNYYLNTNKKTILDDTIFRDFIVNCIGETVQPERQKRLLIESRKKKNKRSIFSYDPSIEIREPETIFQFANTSGNKIINVKNLRLTTLVKNDDIDTLDFLSYDPDNDIEDKTIDKSKKEKDMMDFY